MTAPGRSPGTEPESETRPVPGPRPRTGPLLAVAAVCVVLFAAAAVTVSVHHGAPFAPERVAVRWSVARHGEPALSLARALTDTGTGLIPYLAAVLGGLLAGRGTRGRIRAVACAVAVLAVGQAIRFGLMRLLTRPRPPVTDWAQYASGYAFPSGHATTAVLAAGILAWGIARRARPAVAGTWCAVLAVWAAGVGLTRVYLGVHWPVDVLAGWFLAAALLALALLLEPYAVPRRAGCPDPPPARHCHE